MLWVCVLGGGGIKADIRNKCYCWRSCVKPVFVFASYTLIISEGLYGMFIRDNFKVE